MGNPAPSPILPPICRVFNPLVRVTDELLSEVYRLVMPPWPTGSESVLAHAEAAATTDGEAMATAGIEDMLDWNGVALLHLDGELAVATAVVLVTVAGTVAVTDVLAIADTKVMAMATTETQKRESLG